MGDEEIQLPRLFLSIKIFWKPTKIAAAGEAALDYNSRNYDDHIQNRF